MRRLQLSFAALFVCGAVVTVGQPPEKAIIGYIYSPDRQLVPSDVAAASIVAASASGATGGIGVGTRMRLPTIRPLTSSRASLTPVPPISTARVRGSAMMPLPLRVLGDDTAQRRLQPLPR